MLREIMAQAWKEQGINQTQFAQKLGYDPSYFSKIMSGAAGKNLDFAERIMRELDLVVVTRNDVQKAPSDWIDRESLARAIEEADSILHNMKKGMNSEDQADLIIAIYEKRMSAGDDR